MEKTNEIWAVVLAGGRGQRMNTEVHKQYLPIHGRPVLYYALKAFEESCVTGIVLVCGSGEEDYCRREIVDAFGFKKVRKIVAGGRERYHSVYNGLCAVGAADYVLIHDGARPFVTEEMIERSIACVRKYDACVAAMISKDTVKLADADGFVAATPDRNTVWVVQTPQSFKFSLIKDAYAQLMLQDMRGVTDDAMVLERVCGHPVKFVEGSYMNIKITTPEDLKIAEVIADSIYRE